MPIGHLNICGWMPIFLQLSIQRQLRIFSDFCLCGVHFNHNILFRGIPLHMAIPAIHVAVNRTCEKQS